MEKRFFLALGLSLLVLMVYSSLMQKPRQEAVQEAGGGLPEPSSKHAPFAQEAYPSKEPGHEAPLVKPSQDSKALPDASIDFYNSLGDKNLYTIETDSSTLNFSKQGGFLLEAVDKIHGSTIPISKVGLVKEWAGLAFSALGIPNGVIFEHSDSSGRKIKKVFKVEPHNSLSLSIEISNTTHSATNGYTILTGYFNPAEAPNPFSQRYYEYSVYVNDGIIRKSAFGLRRERVFDGEIVWAGLRDRYFCSILLPQLPVDKAVVYSVDKGVYSAMSIPERRLDGGGSFVQDNFRIYIGPQVPKNLKNFGSRADEIINFGVFNPISKALLFLLTIAQRVTKNWGWSIIIISSLVYFVLLPLSFKSMLSMKRMQTLQPKMEEIRAKHKDNAHKLNIEVMELYKREKVNPLGGCLPMLLQIPVFFALFQLLSRLISLKGAPFLWIKDLSEPDRLLVFNSQLPVVGNELNILPILMAGGMFLQQKFSMASMAKGSSVAEQQKMMSIIMPVLFGFLFYKMPAGLVLYWFVNSMLMFGFQWKISKITT